MASNINYIIIDETFPTAGIDNPSQQFRDNYTAIKNALRVTKTEIETLQATTAKIDASNNFSGNRIIDADFTGVTGKVFLGQDPLTTTQNIDFDNGHFQVFQLGRNITYNLRNWPIAGRFGKIRVAFFGDGVDYRTITFSVDSGTIFYDKAFPVIFSVFFTSRAKIVELSSYSGSDAIYVKYLGEYDTTKYGTGGGGSDISDISELTDENDLLFSKSYNDLTDKPDFKTVATSGLYSDLTGRPTLQPVATSGLYSDLTGRPTALTDFTNTGPNPYINDLGEFTSDDLPEGVNNLYLSEATFTSFFAAANEATISNIPNDTLTDAIELEFTPITTASPTNTIAISNPLFINSYREGQRLKIFGANLTTDDTDITDIVTMSPIIKNGFVSTVSGSLFSYRVAQFRFDNGKIGPSGAIQDVTNVDPDIFNTTNNLTLRVNRTSTDYGLLVYRRITGAINTGTYNLIAILGSKEMGSATEITWTDFYDFDSTAWSKKTIVRNEYQVSSGTIHFPLQAPATPLRGWVYTQIQSINTTTNRIVLTSSFNFNSQVLVSHDDTVAIQTTIDSRAANNLNSLKLGDKTYFVASLDIPANFTVYGSSKQTQIRKLSWGANPYNTNKVFKTVSNALRNNISITNVAIDGNMQNQYLFQETVDEYVNYAVDIKGTRNTFENLNINNTIGGGIASPAAENITINLCQIQDSGMTDRYSYSPIAVGSSFQVLITNNIMRNFPSAVDASTCNIAVLTGNIVNNCGSGILIFGSTKLISSPNLILGPAEEFIKGPDILNSEYDSVNIILEPNTNYTSDSYVYQENGAAFDISSARNRQVLTYRVNQLRKIDNVEELFTEVLISGASPITALVGTYTTGEFRFQITSANVNILTTTYSYATLSQSVAGYVGLVYRALLTEYAPSGDISTTSAPVITSGGPGITFYRVTLSNVSNIGIGSVVRTLSHGGTPNLDSVLGTITNINTVTNQYTISYALSSISAAGSGGQLTVENTFVLAKGRIL